MPNLTTPLVSILIPCYNSATYIAETLESLLEQTYTQWQCIIVDDHSTDNSLKILQHYVSKYSGKFKLYSNPGKGACAARNVAFEKSTGEFIQYLDADDLLSPNKLEEQIKLFNKFGNQIVVNCKWGRFTIAKENVKWEYQPLDIDYENPINWLTDSWMGNGMAQTAVWLTPRHLIEKAGKWEESLTINQDGEFFCRVLFNANGIKFSPNGGVFYRSGLSNSISQTNNSRSKAESLLKSYKSYERVLNIEDTLIIRKALGNNYLNFIYRFNTLYPELSLNAEKHFNALGFRKMWAVGGGNFKRLAQIIGYRAALKLKSYFLNSLFAEFKKC